MGHVFISYSHKDADYAHGLAANLQNMGFDVWIDARLDYGSQWPREIQKQLDNCDTFILVMSPRSFESEWVQSELQRAKRKLKPIFPILLEGDEPWLSVESTQFYDVRRKNLPDEKFFSALRHFASSPITTVGQPPSGRRNKASVFKFAGIRPEYTVAIIGAVATIIAATLPSMFRNAPSTNQTPVVTFTSALIITPTEFLPIVTSAPTFTHTLTITPTPTFTPTFTSTLTMSPTRIPTLTSTLPQGDVIGEVISSLNCRQVPSGVIVTSFDEGQWLVFLGRSSDDSWLYSQKSRCWVISLGIRFPLARGKVEDLPIKYVMPAKTVRP